MKYCEPKRRATKGRRRTRKQRTEVELSGNPGECYVILLPVCACACICVVCVCACIGVCVCVRNGIHGNSDPHCSRVLCALQVTRL
ncbi:hypothetical protein DPEC_G00209380 [Dallia pectoralis]|uniref:Uncharacterized protein n=1 Tax=Dallia pectoralis TaxID=75939 RepID=A0ACC2G5J1_DALPE|nr:hypothetical protein DPEC_G00209380 [Dallia pectoralis]